MGHRLTGPAEVALRVRELAKTYPGTRALRGVSFDVEPGTAHALLGSNGSGKSTLVKVLAGVIRADPGGSIELGGATVAADRITPQLAREHGFRFVHQQPSTFPALSVAENLAIGHGYRRGAAGRIRWREQRRRAREVLERFHLDVDPETPVRSLGPAQQALLEIARALQDQEAATASILVLDEPTASLPAPEADLLLTAVGRYTAAGHTVIFVTHRLHEVVEAADRATVLRDGLVVDTVERADLTEERLIEAIVGRPVLRVVEEARSESASDDVALAVRDLRYGPLRGIDLSIRRGEILGLAGLQGSGRSTLLETLFGLHRPEAGEVVIEGTRLEGASVGTAIRAGIALVPSDRPGHGLFPDMSVLENLDMADLRRYWRSLRLRHGDERADGRGLVDRFNVRTPSLGAPISALSGGNQQKVILARWLRRRPRLLLLDEPTAGIDAGARAEIYSLIREAADAGGAVLVASSEAEELAWICDRVLVLAKGRIQHELARAPLDAERIEELTLTAGQAA